MFYKQYFSLLKCLSYPLFFQNKMHLTILLFSSLAHLFFFFFFCDNLNVAWGKWTSDICAAMRSHFLPRENAILLQVHWFLLETLFQIFFVNSNLFLRVVNENTTLQVIAQFSQAHQQMIRYNPRRPIIIYRLGEEGLEDFGGNHMFLRGIGGNQSTPIEGGQKNITGPCVGGGKGTGENVEESVFKVNILRRSVVNSLFR